MSEVVEVRANVGVHAAPPADSVGTVAARESGMSRHTAASRRVRCAGRCGSADAGRVRCGRRHPGSGRARRQRTAQRLAAAEPGTETAKQGGSSTDTATAKDTTITAEQAARFLQHAQFSAIGFDIAAVRAAGYAGWLTNQYKAPASQSGWDWLESRGYGQVDANRYYNASYPADYMVWHQLFAAPDQMRQRMAFALSQVLRGLHQRHQQPLEGPHDGRVPGIC